MNENVVEKIYFVTEKDTVRRRSRIQWKSDGSEENVKEEVNRKVIQVIIPQKSSSSSLKRNQKRNESARDNARTNESTRERSTGTTRKNEQFGSHNSFNLKLWR